MFLSTNLFPENCNGAFETEFVIAYVAIAGGDSGPGSHFVGLPAAPMTLLHYGRSEIL